MTFQEACQKFIRCNLPVYRWTAGEKVVTVWSHSKNEKVDVPLPALVRHLAVDAYEQGFRDALQKFKTVFEETYDDASGRCFKQMWNRRG